VVASAVDARVAVADDGTLHEEVIYIGAANELALYRTADRGASWLRGPLTHDLVHQGVVGGITDLALDPVQRILYAGTDTAGLFRVRDGEAEMKSTAQLLLDEPVRQVVTDRQGGGMTFARTEWKLYRGLEYGLQWAVVDTLSSIPTAMALAESHPVALYVGTLDQGVLRSVDSVNWTQLGIGLISTPNEPLYVDALAVDPQQPTMAYVAFSRRVNSQYVRYAPDQIAYTHDGGASWTLFPQPKLAGRITNLIPASGYGAAAYFLTTTKRTPQAVGDAPVVNVPLVTRPAQAAATPNAGRVTLAWLVAGMAASALAFALLTDIFRQPEVPLAEPVLTPRRLRRDPKLP
jgi:hypothetical protein